jgi:hypothetical protein
METNQLAGMSFSLHTNGHISIPKQVCFMLLGTTHEAQMHIGFYMTTKHNAAKMA